MGTSMTSPDVADLRLKRKPMQTSGNPTANKFTKQRIENIPKPIKLRSEPINLKKEQSKQPQQPQTAVTQAVVSPASSVEPMEKEQFVKQQKNVAANYIWQTMSESAVNHFRKADENRKKNIKVVSASNQENNENEKKDGPIMNLQECKASTFKDQKIPDCALSINSKIINSSGIKNEGQNDIIRKKILLPNVQIINSIKQKRKLKRLYKQESYNQAADKRWSGTS